VLIVAETGESVWRREYRACRPSPSKHIFRDTIETDTESDSRLRYLEGMERVHRALGRDTDAEALLQGCVEVLLDLFEADRCMLAFPCEPGSEAIRFPFYAERPEACPRPFPREVSPVPEPMRRAILALQQRSEPLEQGPEDPSPIGPDAGDRPSIRRRLNMAIRPKSGPAWNLTLHRCREDRPWAPDEILLFRDAAASIRSSLETLNLTRNLRASEAFLHTMTERLPHLLWATDGAGKVEFVNRRWMEFTGQSLEHSLGTGGLDALHPEDRALCMDLWSEALRTGKPYEAELRYRRADGTYLWHLVRAYPITDAEGKAIRWIGSCTDISEAKRVREEAEHARAQLATILSGAADSIMALDRQGKVVYANEAAARLFGLASSLALIELTDRAFAEGRRDEIRFLDENGEPYPIERIPTRQALRGIQAPPVMLRFRPAPDGPERWIIAKANPIFDESGQVSLVISLTQDITELKTKEEAVRRLEKLESLGKLAGGVAHDFNNLLVSINGYSDLGMRMAADQPALREFFEEIHRSGERAASLTRQLLAYGRKQLMRPRRLDLSSVVGGMRDLLSRSLGPDIRLHAELAPDLPPVEADPGQVEQVILNLVMNARDAMPAGGTVTVRTGTAMLGPGGEIARPGPHVELTVSDTGSGMDPAVLARAFEPFFSTKGMGAGTDGRAGTGLGLASVYGIVKQCGGHIEAESSVGRGATFRIFLPVSQSAEGAPEGDGNSQATSGGRIGPILLAEDEDSVRMFAERVLTGRGFRVLTARDGEEALRIAEACPGLELLLTDVVMPGLRGPELALRVRSIHPDARILMMSGYPDDTGLSSAEGWAFLPKPFRAEQLLEKVEGLLKAPVPGQA
jgi:two-component system cell cycle sensor histidine kinase/response regulator CckA